MAPKPIAFRLSTALFGVGIVLGNTLNQCKTVDISALWDDGLVHIPAELATACRETLSDFGLLEKASGPRPATPPVGGWTQEQTDEHFCHAYDGSLARIQLVLTNATGGTPIASRSLLEKLSGGDLCLVDVPAGAGAGALSLLACVAKLRQADVLPRQPLNVRLLWGELSEPALNYANYISGKLNEFLESQAIFVTIERFQWDVLSDVSNTNLIEKIVTAKISSPLVLLIVCNFHGFLEREGKWNEAKSGIDQLMRFCSGDLNSAVWIEPDQRAVLASFFPNKLSILIKKLKAFVRMSSVDQDGEFANARFQSYLNTDLCPRVNARVLPLDLARNAE